MRVPNYLVIGSNFRYYFRIVVPKSLRNILGQREFRRSLKTMDQRVALRLSLTLADKYLRYFEVEMMKLDPLMKQLTIQRIYNENGTLKSETIDLDDDNLEKDLKRLEGYEKSKAHQPMQSLCVPGTSQMMLSEAIELLVAEKKLKGAWTDGTTSENISSYRQLVSLPGDRLIQSVTRQDTLRVTTHPLLFLSIS